MTSFRKVTALGLALVALSPLAAQTAADPLAPLPTTPTPAPSPNPTIQRAPVATTPPAVVVHRPLPGAARQAPAALSARINALGSSFNGKAGIAVVSLKDGWEVDWNANSLFPQQSCSKLWVAITALDAVDRGEVKLTDRVTIGRDDLTLFHQPLRELVMGKGSHSSTVGQLMFTAITQSDNTANDSLMRAVGGPNAVRSMIARKGLGSIRFFDGERSLQSKIAGLTWSQSYSIGDAFYRARSALPASVRQASFNRYISDPYDGAAPHAVANSIARLYRGELLSPDSTRRLLTTMGSTVTGKARVRAALAPGWKWNHKTGTGQNLGGKIGGLNDIGLLTAPDGTVYAMAIMTVPNRTDGAAQGLMQSVTRAVIAAHQAR